MSSERGPIVLAIARAALSSALGAPQRADERAAWLHEPGATFVTLTQAGRLRGCIGSLQAWRPLLDDLKHNAVAAGLRDPRFHPMTTGELSCTRVEASLLSAAEPLHFDSEADALAQLTPGIDGVTLEYRNFRSTYLPQVWEHFPHPERFLASLKQKAGLPTDFWSREVSLSRYTVEKFREEEAAAGAQHG